MADFSFIKRVISVLGIGQGPGGPSTYLNGDNNFVPFAAAARSAAPDFYSQPIFCSQFNPTSGQTIYFSSAIVGPTTTEGVRRQYILQSGTITAVSVNLFIATMAGSNENWTFSIRHTVASSGVSTNYLIQTVGATTSQRNFTNLLINNGAGIPVVAGDWWQIVAVNPTWATPPQGIVTQGSVVIKT